MVICVCVREIVCGGEGQGDSERECMHVWIDVLGVFFLLGEEEEREREKQRRGDCAYVTVIVRVTE